MPDVFTCTTITINKPNGQIQTINTPEGYVVLYLDQGKLKNVGELELKALAPYLLKILAERMVK